MKPWRAGEGAVDGRTVTVAAQDEIASAVDTVLRGLYERTGCRVASCCVDLPEVGFVDVGAHERPWRFLPPVCRIEVEL